MVGKNETQDFGFSVEEIYPFNINDEEFGITIIPDSKSNYFPPFHTRVVRVSPELLSMHFYSAIREKNTGLPSVDEINFTGKVIQGGYYKVTGKKLPTKVVTSEMPESEIFNNRMVSPYSEEKSDSVNDLNILSNPGKETTSNLYIYCFNVGQGDSFLLIFPNGSVYIIDTNIYGPAAKVYVDTVKGILKDHGLPVDKIKAMIFTHKHLDHIRGAARLINELAAEYFVINLDYPHPTKPVADMLHMARKKIPLWINCNKEATIFEGTTKICVRNPDDDTSCQIKAPDINDSSICLCIHHENNRVYLTGDAGYSVLNRKYVCGNMVLRNINENLLKIAHHGSDSGTNVQVLGNLKPSHCFISAGQSSKYNHPSPQVMNLLKSYAKAPEILVSRALKRNIRYKITGKSIQCKFF